MPLNILSFYSCMCLSRFLKVWHLGFVPRWLRVGKLFLRLSWKPLSILQVKFTLWSSIPSSLFRLAIYYITWGFKNQRGITLSENCLSTVLCILKNILQNRLWSINLLWWYNFSWLFGVKFISIRNAPLYHYLYENLFNSPRTIPWLCETKLNQNIWQIFLPI